MSSSQPSAVESLFAEGSGDLVSERRVLGAEPFDFGSCGVEALAHGVVGGALCGWDRSGIGGALAEADDVGEEVGLFVEPAA